MPRTPRYEIRLSRRAGAVAAGLRPSRARPGAPKSREWVRCPCCGAPRRAQSIGLAGKHRLEVLEQHFGGRGAFLWTRKPIESHPAGWALLGRLRVCLALATKQVDALLRATGRAVIGSVPLRKDSWVECLPAESRFRLQPLGAISASFVRSMFGPAPIGQCGSVFVE